MVLIDMGLYSHIPGGHFKIHILKIQGPLFIYRYKTTVSSAREKDCAYRNGHGAILIWCYSHINNGGKPNMALIYPKSNAECRGSVFDGQMND